jgi:tRNA(Ile)-lysidine synthase
VIIVPLPQLVADFFTNLDLGGSSGVVALSGGPDSVCVAKILGDLFGQKGFSKLVLAHLNHQLRGPDSEKDEAFVRELARAWKLTCRIERRDVAAVARAAGANLEDTARRLRYEWFAQVAQEEGANWVATGHSADDQAETVLFRFLRGSGLQGLAGMAQRRPLVPGIDLVRPLLPVNRAAILAFLKKHQQAFCHDSSNLDLGFTRNRLRHELLPLLTENYNPAIAEILCRLAEQARAVQEEIAQWARQLLAQTELPRAENIIVLEIAGLKRTSRHLRCELFRLVWAREKWPMGRMTYEAWNHLAELVEEDRGSLDLPEGISGKNIGRVLQLKRQ